ncbi:MAG: non-ribosomal peptide synthetase, partial [bacterium]|nr:non-ribosomal peptide synthetase [bacterium]
ARLENAFKKLIRLHESLRTSFHMITPFTSLPPNDQSPITGNSLSPAQVISEDVAFEIEYYKTGGGREMETAEDVNLNEVSKTFFRAFDLTKAPLLRVGIIETAGADDSAHNHFMMLDMHHIITDGTSQQILTRDFFALYGGVTIAPLKIQYKDYAEWQNSSMHTQLLEQQETFWVNRFSGELPVLNLPTDYPRPAIRSFEGSNLYFELNEKETAKLKETAKKNEATLYMTLLSLYTILLSKLGGQEDIIVGIPTAGRGHADLENIIGMFVNTLVMRNFPDGDKTFREFLSEIKKRTLEAFDNQEYQFEALVDRLSVRRDTGRNPIFDVMFNLLNQTEYSEQNTSNSPNSLNSPDYFPATSKFALTFSGFETGNSIYFHFEYCTKLFKEETIRRFVTYFKGIMQIISTEPGRRLAEIEIITEEEKKQILYEFNDTAAEYP